MGIELPPELADVAARTGVAWPRADEDKMRAAATAWREAGTKLTALAGESDGSATTALRGLTGETGDAARRHWNTFVAPDGSLTRTARGCTAAADRLDHAARQIGAAKVEIVRELVNLAKNTEAANQAANAGHPTAGLGLDTLLSGAKANVANLTNTLTSAVRLDSGIDIGNITHPVNPNPGVHQPGGHSGGGTGTPVLGGIVPGGNTSGGIVPGIVPPLTDTVGAVVTPVVDGVATPVTGVVTPVVDPLTGGVVNPVVGGVVDPLVGGVVTPVVGEATPIVGDLVDGAGQVTAPVSEVVTPIVQPVVDGLVAPVTGGVADTVGTVTNPVLDKAAEAVGPVAEPIVREVREVTAPVENVTRDTTQPVADTPPGDRPPVFQAQPQPHPAGPVATPEQPVNLVDRLTGQAPPPPADTTSASSAAAVLDRPVPHAEPAHAAQPTTSTPNQQTPPPAAPAAPAAPTTPSTPAAPTTRGPEPVGPRGGAPAPSAPAAFSSTSSAQSGPAQSGSTQSSSGSGNQPGQSKDPQAKDIQAKEAQAKEAQAKEAQAKEAQAKESGKEPKENKNRDSFFGFAVLPIPASGRDRLVKGTSLPGEATFAPPATAPDAPEVPEQPPYEPVPVGRDAEPADENTAAFLPHMFPGGLLPRPSEKPHLQLPPPSADEAFAAGLRFGPQGHPEGDLVDDTARVRRRVHHGPGHDPSALLTGYDPQAGMHERDWDRRFLVRATPPEYAYPPGELFPEGGYEAGQAGVLGVGTEVDRFGGPEGRVLAETGTPFTARSLPPAVAKAPYHRYRVTRDVPVWFTLSAEWFGQRGGGVRYRTTYPVADLVALGYLEEIR
ncbi:hypothetical protein GCM10022243_07140 [Saccharothrix violaceirubra]|uniref:DUF4237 domain-containing protein n=1 Tax=Saccharothrix violaceirubra TaxID=413306 RepID=A0A7W7SY77_9PSEU|nr:TNT domain-containing protein [Saccharothrix violaceirubra]MBB4963126.1 hypothetical protein [Saccharothrix violaceirubra]